MITNRRILRTLPAAWGMSAALMGMACFAPDAAGQPGNPFAAIAGQLQSMQQQLQMIQQQHQGLQQQLDTIEQKLDALPAPAGLVPFTAQTAGGLCDSGPSPSSNPEIHIEGTGSSLFVVTSILLKTAPQPAGEDGYTFLTVNSVQVDGTTFDTRTGNLVASSDGSGVQESADLMGTPVRIAAPSSLTAVPRTASPAGGNFPHQIVADGANSNDIRIQLFCRSDLFDLSVDAIRVSGWKSPEASVSVTYVPGN